MAGFAADREGFLMELPDVRWDLNDRPPAEYLLLVDGNESGWRIQCQEDGSFLVVEDVFNATGDWEGVTEHGAPLPTLEAAKASVKAILEDMAFNLADFGTTPVPWLDADRINARLYREVIN